MPKMIRRTYNKYGEGDFLTRFEGNVPFWVGDPKQALTFTEDEAAATLATVAAYRDPFCPNGIEGLTIVAASDYEGRPVWACRR